MKVIKKFIVLKEMKRISSYSNYQTISKKGEVFIFQNDYDPDDDTYTYFKASDINYINSPKNCERPLRQRNDYLLNRTYWLMQEDLFKLQEQGKIIICCIGDF